MTTYFHHLPPVFETHSPLSHLPVMENLNAAEDSMLLKLVFSIFVNQTEVNKRKKLFNLFQFFTKECSELTDCHVHLCVGRKARHCPQRPEVQEHPREEELHLRHRRPGLGCPSWLCHRHHWHRAQSKGGHQEVCVNIHACSCWPSCLTDIFLTISSSSVYEHKRGLFMRLTGTWLQRFWMRRSTWDTLTPSNVLISMLWGWSTGRLHGAVTVEVRFLFFTLDIQPVLFAFLIQC